MSKSVYMHTLSKYEWNKMQGNNWILKDLNFALSQFQKK